MYRPYFKQRPQRRSDGEDVHYNKIPVSYPNITRNCAPYEIPARKSNIPSGIYGIPSPIIQTMDYNITQLHSTVPFKSYLPQSYSHTDKKNMASNVSDKFRYVESYRNIKTATDCSNNDHWRSQSSYHDDQYRARSQTESVNCNKQSWGRNFSRSLSTNNISENEDNENYIPPSKLLRANNSNGTARSTSPLSVDLLVTNLDQNLDPKDLQNLLHSLFQEYSTVLNLSIFQQTDGNLAANVRVSSVQDAQYVISQLHRRKVGHKRIVISHTQNSTANPQILRSQVIALLLEVPGYKMPLFKFRELLESRYRCSVPVSEIYKLRDICLVSEGLGGRMISLCPNLCLPTSTSHLSPHNGLESPHCTVHCPNGLVKRGWGDPETPTLPNVRIKLKDFAIKVQELLHSHLGTLPLLSFPVCYEIEMKEKLPIDDTGVPLEHLLTCVVGIELRLSNNMVKYLVWDNKTKKNDNVTEVERKSSNSSGSSGSATVKCISPPLATQLALFSRELVDLLKTAPHCQLAFSRFIPAYHHHFGRQCRVADYGHTKLVDLFDSLPQVVQILGDGNKRVLTLAHSAQVRRFTSDLLRVLKSQASKQLILNDFQSAYERVLSRNFDPVDYGLCELSDLLDEVSENTVVIKQIQNDVIIAIPKRDQTPEEILKTKQFTVEVVDLLRHAHQYRILFNKFVPAYHHHFGHQCRVSDYGFTKLIDLFEVIPDIVKIDESTDGERTVSLTAKEALKVVQQQITSIVKTSRLQSMPLEALSVTFLREYGYGLRPEIYECETIEELIAKLPDSLQLISGPAGLMIMITEESIQQHLGIKIWSLLLQPPHTSTLSNILKNFQSKYNYIFTIQQTEKYSSIIEIIKSTNDETHISLTPRYALAARLYHLLFENNGTILLGNVDGMYFRKYGKILRPAEYDATNLNILLSQLSFLVVVRGRRNKRNVALNMSIGALGILLPPSMKCSLLNDGNNNTNCNDQQWPPPPAHTIFNSGRTTISPPKPDTPPTHGYSQWYSKLWSPSRFASPENLCIALPFMKTPQSLGNPRTLYSPMKNLLPAYPNTEIQVPIPNLISTSEQINKGKVTSPSRDSGIGCTSFCNSMEELLESSLNVEYDLAVNKYEFLNFS